jgi:CRISPR-associated endonuclease Csn1
LPKYPEHKKWVETVNGKITAHLRSRWGLEKHRDDTHLHHAMDAVVIACTDNRMIQQITNYYKIKESNSFIKKPIFPVPWDGFRDELLTQLNELPIPEEIELALDAGAPLPRYLLVSRMARYSVTGAAHKETIMMDGGIDQKTGKTIITKRVPLNKIKFDKNGDFPMVNKDLDPATYQAIKERLLNYNGNVKEAFDIPLYKPSKKGIGNPIRRVKVEVEQKTHVRHVNGGVAQNGDLVRIDLFIKEDTYYMVPVYVLDTSLSELPNKVVTSGKGYAQWKELDDTFKFQFSLHPYDLVRLKNGAEDKFLYFSTIDIGSNRILFKEPNYPHEQIARRYTLSGIDSLQKYLVSPLGDLSLVKKETRRNFNRKKEVEKV